MFGPSSKRELTCRCLQTADAAAQQGHLAVAVELVKAGANLEHKDVNGKTPLAVAADGGGHRGVMRMLIEAGAAKTAARRMDPLRCSAWHGRVTSTGSRCSFGRRLTLSCGEHTQRRG